MGDAEPDAGSLSLDEVLADLEECGKFPLSYGQETHGELHLAARRELLRLSGDPLPVLHGAIVDRLDRLILRQTSGEGSLGDTKIFLSSTAGLGGFSLIVEVEPPGEKRVYVEYDLAPLVEQIAEAVLGAR